MEYDRKGKVKGDIVNFKISFRIPLVNKRIVIEKYIGKTLPEITIEDEYYLRIYNELKKKYPEMPDYIIRRAAKTGYRWLMSIVKGMPEKYRKVVIERRINDAITLSENWIKEWIEAMFD